MFSKGCKNLAETAIFPKVLIVCVENKRGAETTDIFMFTNNIQGVFNMV